MNNTTPTVILGGGFAGLFTALHLCSGHYPRPIILIDQAERFVFKPLLYELLSGEMTDIQVQPRYDELLNCDGITFVQDSVRHIDLQQRQVKLASGLSYSYSNLVLALGSTSSYFGIKGVQEYTFGFRTGDDAQALKRHLRECLQRASQTNDPEQRRSLLTVAVIGAGPSGIEMAATLADLLPKWYLQFGGNPEEIKIVIVNRGKQILQGDVNSGLRQTALQALQQRTVPVELVLGASVKTIYCDRLEYQQDDQLKTRSAATMIWTAGNGVHPLLQNLSIPEQGRDSAGRLRVTPTLQLPDFLEVFVGGDCAVLDQPLPATAQVAYQQGAAIAHNLQAIAKGNQLKPATVSMRGTLMKLGLGEGVANLFDRFMIIGRSGHLIRQGTYLELLPTPVHNFKATVGWLTDELFRRYSQPILKSQPQTPVLQWAGNAAAALVMISSGLLFWRTVQQTQFEQALQPTGLPALLNQIQQGESAPLGKSKVKSQKSKVGS
ncbi:NAD(P)/FAD-dependent oxidoreductase [Iningainema tapete]|uniref:NAD(P)/FAD-dependent oxidoreductase n=1 Tax=Iningainema tapete BLCC-T55 TaxID=2748662 RepID=A0A8J7C7S4_9CYAN|nr:NAD(P)/FAD-dependent oxidoreductase [Iningainema tapete]MBD2773656.1 NAD(P)/FAD-dependent oxidoreductase [Iningainema tapete BLCC-T55]